MSAEEKYGAQAQEFENTDFTAQQGDGYVPSSQKEEKRIIRKLDARLLLFVFVLYSLSVLDRSNLGNAKLANMVSNLRCRHLQELRIC